MKKILLLLLAAVTIYLGLTLIPPFLSDLMNESQQAESSTTSEVNSESEQVESSCQQSESSALPEMKFWGIPFGSNRQEVERKLKKKGGRFRKTEYGLDLWQVGSPFAGYPVEALVVGYTPDGRLSSGRVILQPWRERGVLERYEQLKKQLTTKYGKPTKVVDKYNNPDDKDYLDKFDALELDKYQLAALWEVGKEKERLAIRLWIDSDCTIFIEYTHKGLYAANEQQNLDDL